MLNNEDFQEHFPFLSIIDCQGEEFVGIVQNSDEKIISFYDFNSIKTDDEKRQFLELGEIWWWESNRLLPISIFMNHEMKTYRYCLRSIIKKDSDILLGPCTSLNNLIQKRIKRRQISLIKRDS